jgi:hypothetical protein
MLRGRGAGRSVEAGGGEGEAAGGLEVVKGGARSECETGIWMAGARLEGNRRR